MSNISLFYSGAPPPAMSKSKNRLQHSGRLGSGAYTQKFICRLHPDLYAGNL